MTDWTSQVIPVHMKEKINEYSLAVTLRKGTCSFVHVDNFTTCVIERGAWIIIIERFADRKGNYLAHLKYA